MDDARRGKLREGIVAILVKHGTADLAAARITDDTPLFDGGLKLDSLAFMQSLLEIEELAKVTLDDESASRDVLRNVGSVVAHVASVMEKAGGGGP